jgi:uncharacterized membrane protein
MQKTIAVLTFVMGMLLLVTGTIHFLNTRSYLPIVPEIFPGRMLIIQVSGGLELAAGIGLLIRSTRHIAAFVVLILMIGFLPLHIWDIFRERPAMGTKMGAWSRLALQFVLIAWAWFIWNPFSFRSARTRSVSR